nr:MAG TPA: hypothetical protein [Caudoviricetes sp.]
MCHIQQFCHCLIHRSQNSLWKGLAIKLSPCSNYNTQKTSCQLKILFSPKNVCNLIANIFCLDIQRVLNTNSLSNSIS